MLHKFCKIKRLTFRDVAGILVGSTEEITHIFKVERGSVQKETEGTLLWSSANPKQLLLN